MGNNPPLIHQVRTSPPISARPTLTGRSAGSSHENASFTDAGSGWVRRRERRAIWSAFGCSP